MRWEFTVANRAGEPLGELRQATGRSLRFPLNRTPTFAFTVRTDNPLIEVLRRADTTLIKGYQVLDDGSRWLRYLGPVTNYQKSVPTNTVSFTSAGVGWRLQRRYFGFSAAGMSHGSPTNPIDRGELAWFLIASCNVGGTLALSGANDTGVRLGTVIPSSKTWIGPWAYKNLAEAITELSAPLDGFDWEIEPTEPTADREGLMVGRFNAAPMLGTMNPNAVWEYGDGLRNVASWTETVDANALCNLGISVPSVGDAGGALAQIAVSDTVSIAERGLHEALITSDLPVQNLRQKLVEEHVRIRSTPRRTITFEPIAEDDPPAGEPRRVPRLFDDYRLGDIMPFRATEAMPVIGDDGSVVGHTPVKTLDGLFRAFVVQLDIDDAGGAKPSLTLVEEA